MKYIWILLIVLALPSLANAVCQSTFHTGISIKSLIFCVGPNGNVNQIQVSAGQLIAHEGYAVCKVDNGLTSWYDTGIASQGWGDAVIVQPNGVNTFPITVNRTSTDGVISLSQTYKWGSGRSGVHVSMTLRTLILGQFHLVRYADVQVANEIGDSTQRTAFVWGGGTGLLASPGAMPNASAFISDASSTTDPCQAVSGSSPFVGNAAEVITWIVANPEKGYTVGIDYRPMP